MAPKQPCAKYEYVVTPTGPKILPVDEPSCKDEESPADYNAGGYLPVKVNDAFCDNRYTVVRKLGWGHFSTVWLVKDSHTHRHSALKVVKSAGRYVEAAREEIKLLSRVSSFSPLHPGRQHIVSFLDSFSHQGLDAQHVCIVFEPLGENLLALIERNQKKGVPRSLVKVITRQILLGLEYLHDECDLVHTDIKPENILISIPDIEMHIRNELSQSPLPTSRRVGVPLPAKTRVGVRTRRQVQIFDSQPLASPGRSVGRGSSKHASLSMNPYLGTANGQDGSNTHRSRILASTTQAISAVHLSSPKLPGDSSHKDPPLPGKTRKIAKIITAIPSGIIKSTSTSSSSSSISSAVACTTAGSSSMVSTPPTSLSHSLGNTIMEFMRTGKFEAKLRTTQSPKKSKTQKEDAGMPGVVPTSLNASSEVVSGFWKDKVSLLFSTKFTSSPSEAIKHPQLGHGHTRSHSGLSNARFWQNPGTAALAPAVLCSAVVGADGRQYDFSKLSTVTDIEQLHNKSTSGSSSANATVVRPNQYRHLSLLKQTAPSRPLATTFSSKPTITRTRVSPSQQVSQLSAHMLFHKPSSFDQQPFQAPTSVTPPTPTSPTLAAPPPTPSDSSTLSTVPTVTNASTPPFDIISQSNYPRTRSTLQSPSENKPCSPKISVKIADLGNAAPSKKHFTEEIQTRQYRAPEAILGRRDWDARADIWSVACVVFELLTAEYLFDPHGKGELFRKDDDHMAQIIELLGDFSLEAKMGGKYSRELFDHTGSLRYIRTLKPWPLKRVMIEKYLFSEADAVLLCEFLEPLLAVDTRDRAHARDVKDHKWLEITLEDGIVTEW